MLSRGLARRFPAGVERAAEEARATTTATTAAAPRPARPDDVHDRPGHRQGLRRRDLLRAARRRALARLGPHRRRHPLRPARLARSTARPTGARPASTSPGAVEPMLPARAVQRRLLARPRRGPPHGVGRDGVRGRRRRAGRLPPLADPLGRAAGLRAGRPDLRRRGARRRSPGRRRWPAARERWPALRGAARAPGNALVIDSAEPEFRFEGGHVVGVGREAPDRVAPADRAPDDRRQRAGRPAADRAQDPRAATASTSARAGGGRAPGRPARLARRRRRRRCPSSSRPSRRPTRSARSRGCVDAARAPDRPRPPGADVAGAARAQAGPLRAAAARPRRARARALLPLHLADPPLPRHRLPPRAAQRDRRRGRTRRAPPRWRRPGVQTSGARARRDDHRARRRRRRPLLPARAAAVRGGLRHASSTARSSASSAPGRSCAFGEGYQGLLPVRKLRGDWWELNEEGTMLRGSESGQRDPAGRPGRGARRARRHRPRPRRSAARAGLPVLGRSELDERSTEF